MTAIPNGGSWTYGRSLCLADQYSAIFSTLVRRTPLIQHPAKHSILVSTLDRLADSRGRAVANCFLHFVLRLRCEEDLGIALVG